MVLVAVVLIVLGVLIKYARMHFLIAGYNTMSKEKKAQYNIELVATLMRNVLFAMACLILIGYFLAKWLNNPDLETISLSAAILIGILFLVVKLNSATYKIDHNNTDSN